MDKSKEKLDKIFLPSGSKNRNKSPVKRTIAESFHEVRKRKCHLNNFCSEIKESEHGSKVTNTKNNLHLRHVASSSHEYQNKFNDDSNNVNDNGDTVNNSNVNDNVNSEISQENSFSGKLVNTIDNSSTNYSLVTTDNKLNLLEIEVRVDDLNYNAERDEIELVTRDNECIEEDILIEDVGFLCDFDTNSNEVYLKVEEEVYDNAMFCNPTNDDNLIICGFDNLNTQNTMFNNDNSSTNAIEIDDIHDTEDLVLVEDNSEIDGTNSYPLFDNIVHNENESIDDINTIENNIDVKINIEFIYYNADENGGLSNNDTGNFDLITLSEYLSIVNEHIVKRTRSGEATFPYTQLLEFLHYFQSDSVIAISPNNILNEMSENENVANNDSSYENNSDDSVLTQNEEVENNSDDSVLTQNEEVENNSDDSVLTQNEEVENNSDDSVLTQNEEVEIVISPNNLPNEMSENENVANNDASYENDSDDSDVEEVEYDDIKAIKKAKKENRKADEEFLRKKYFYRLNFTIREKNEKKEKIFCINGHFMYTVDETIKRNVIITVNDHADVAAAFSDGTEMDLSKIHTLFWTKYPELSMSGCLVLLPCHTENTEENRMSIFTLRDLWYVKENIPVNDEFKDLNMSNLHVLLENETWLTGDIVYNYCLLCAKLSKNNIYVFNTQFMTNLIDRGYSSIRRWTKNVDIFSFDKLLIPYNKDKVHWTLILIDLKQKKVMYYDSFGEMCANVCKVIDYLKLEHKDKKQKDIELDNWTVNLEASPAQTNTCDCGVFVCMTAKSICYNRSLSFSQNDTFVFRKIIIYELLLGYEELKKKVPFQIVF